MKVIHSFFPETFQDIAQNISVPSPAEKKPNTPLTHLLINTNVQKLKSDKTVIKPRHTKGNNCQCHILHITHVIKNL
jgi:hypothetical protein